MFWNEPNEFAALRVSRFQPSSRPSAPNFKTLRLLNDQGQLDTSALSNEELLVVRSVLRDLPAETKARVKWDPKVVIAAIDAELQRRADQH